MPRPIILYVRWIDRLNRTVGRAVMYLIFVMMGFLIFTSISRNFFNTSYIWSLESAQFLLTGYYLLGGGYSIQLGTHVRMDLAYSRWSPQRRAAVDALTSCFLLFYLGFLLFGGISSTQYAIDYGQTNYSTWAPKLWPIKVVMCVGILLMLLQSSATFFRDLAAARGRPLS